MVVLEVKSDLVPSQEKDTGEMNLKEAAGKEVSIYVVGADFLQWTH